MKTIKLLFGILLLIFLSNNLISQTSKDLDRIGKINGKVKSIKENHYTVTENFGEIEPNEMLYKIEYNLDKNQNINSVLFISQNSYVIGQFYFNDLGLIERLNYSFEDQSPQKFIIYKYTDDRIKSVKYYFDYGLQINDPSFEPKDNIIELKEDKYLIDHYSYNYNENFDVVDINHNRLGTLGYFLIRNENTLPFGKYFDRLEIINKVRRDVEHYRDGYSEGYIQSEENHFKVTIGRVKDSYSLKAKFKDEMIDYLVINQSFEYQYDNKGNWTECVIKYFEKSVELIKRKIMYFE